MQASSARLAVGIAAAVLVLAVCALAGTDMAHAGERAAARSRRADRRVGPVAFDGCGRRDAERLARARDATAALLRGAAGEQLGVVVFSGDAFASRR
jgi:hypothetical protein